MRLGEFSYCFCLVLLHCSVIFLKCLILCVSLLTQSEDSSLAQATQPRGLFKAQPSRQFIRDLAEDRKINNSFVQGSRIAGKSCQYCISYQAPSFPVFLRPELPFLHVSVCLAGSCLRANSSEPCGAIY